MFTLIAFLISSLFAVSVPTAQASLTGPYFDYEDLFPYDYDADDLLDRKIRFNPRKITDIAGKINQIGQVLGYDAEDIENDGAEAVIDLVCKIINTVCKVTDTGVKVHDTVKKSRGADSLDLLSYDVDDLDDSLTVAAVCAIIGAVCAVTNTGLNIYDHVKGDDVSESLAFAADDLLDKKFKFNPRKITDIAGKINQIGQVLGYDADDLDDVAVATVCAIIGAICAVTGTGCNIYSHVKGDDVSESLAFAADDLLDKKFKFNPHRITEIAGKINQIGQVLGYDVEDLDDSLTVAAVCAIIGAVCAVTNTGLNIYDHVKGDDEMESLAFAVEEKPRAKQNKSIKLTPEQLHKLIELSPPKPMHPPRVRLAVQPQYPKF